MNFRLLKPVVFQVLVVSIFIVSIKYLKFIPYNIKELFSTNNVFTTITAFSMVLYIFFGVPVLLANQLTLCKNWFTAMIFSGFGLAFGVVTFLLLYISIPMESLHDIVGAPVYNWPWISELIYRFTFLFSFFWMLWCLAALIIHIPKIDKGSYGFILCWAFCTTVMLLMSYLVVVQNAGTDNLIELIENRGGLMSSMVLSSWVLAIGLTASIVCKIIVYRRHPFWFLLIIISSVLIGYYLLNLGMVKELTKYGKTFSGLQFLLSEDRDHYAEGLHLAVRYCLFHMGINFMMVVCQYPFWKFLMPGKDCRRFR